MAEHKKDNTKLFKLVSNDGPKLKWYGDCEQLKILLETELSLSGTWSSPEENKREFKLDPPTISFNENTKTLVVNGEGSEELKQRLLQTENDLPASSSGGFLSTDQKERKGNKRQEKKMAEHTDDNTNLFDLVSRDDPKLKWRGNLWQLKSLLEKKLSLSGTWSLPEPNVHEFKVDTPTISFYEDTKTLVINGEGSERLIKRLLIRKARSLASQFMSKNPRCIKAIPYESEDAGSLTMCLYMDTDERRILEEIKGAANDQFKNYKIEFHDLSKRPLTKIVTRLPSSKKQKAKEIANLARIIEKNLDLFENRMNVTSVQASYKVTASIEKNIPCVKVYVLGKGKIPAGETDIDDIKKKIEEGHPLKQTMFDVAEGYHKLTTGSSLKGYALPLEGGVGIGVKGVDEAGTLGGFLQDKEGKVYILSNEHVLHPYDEGDEKDIVQPSEMDYNTMKKEAEERFNEYAKKARNITSTEINEANKRYSPRVFKKIEKERKKAEERLNEIESEKFRHIGKYVYGLNDNIRLENDGREFYVDAAIATLNDTELFDIECHKIFAEDRETRCPLYGFETNKYWKTEDYNPPNGEIIDFQTFQDCFDNEDPELRFMKIGRTTGLTDECFVNPPSRLLRYNSSWARNCFPFRKLEGPFSKEGDSGSLVFDNNGRAWGLVYGAFTDFGDEFPVSLVAPLCLIVDVLKGQAGGRELRLWCRPNHEGSDDELASHELLTGNWVTSSCLKFLPMFFVFLIAVLCAYWIH